MVGRIIFGDAELLTFEVQAMNPFRRLLKRRSEIGYWRSRRKVEGTLNDLSEKYRYTYTEHFGLNPDDYRGKRIMDIGCGPRGSLEWCEGAEELVGLDPLAHKYERIQPYPEPRMNYVRGSAEAIPFPDGYFDFVTSLNSLDHVDDPPAAITEIARVTRPGGRFLLLVEINHPPRRAEPWRLQWDVVDDVAAAGFDVKLKEGLEYDPDGIHAALRGGDKYRWDDPTDRPAYLIAMFERIGRRDAFGA